MKQIGFRSHKLCGLLENKVCLLLGETTFVKEMVLEEADIWTGFPCLRIDHIEIFIPWCVSDGGCNLVERNTMIRMPMIIGRTI